MSTIVEFPGGGSAVLKDAEEMTNKEVKSLRRAARQATVIALELEHKGFADDDPESWRALAEMPEDDYDNLDGFQRTCAFVRLQSWTLDRPLPSTPDDIDDLPRMIYVPLITAATNIQLADEFTVEGAGDPKVATADSANSEQP